MVSMIGHMCRQYQVPIFEKGFHVYDGVYIVEKSSAVCLELFS